MLKSILLILGFLLAGSAYAEDGYATLYNICRDKVDNAAYGSSQWERTCSEDFDMAKPSTIKCAKFVRDGFPKNDNDLELKTCKFLCESNENWGPWYDYELPYDLKEIVLEMKRRHNTGKCQAP